MQVVDTVYIETGLISHVDLFAQVLPSNRIMLVVDQQVAQYYLTTLKSTLSDYQLDICSLPAGEIYKTWSSVDLIINCLLENGHDRNTTIISLGGGVIGDLAGFVASIFMRGTHLVHVPSSLLAQIDACIGGKTGYNHQGIKNLIGTYYPAHAVLIDPDLLKTLPQREFIAAFAEAIKYAMAFDAELFIWLENNAVALIARDAALLSELIVRCCRLKTKVVAGDIRDLQQRRCLNFGHTYGHAIEAASNYQYLHGEAVALGMLLISKLALQKGMLQPQAMERLQALIIKFGLPTQIDASKCRVELINKFLYQDKKKHAQQLTLILPYDIGKVGIVENLMEEHVCI